MVCLILIASATIGLFNTFPSPIIRDTYYHATHMDFMGTEWFLRNQNDDFQIILLSHALMRFSHASMGYSAIPKNVLEIDMLSPPDHFGYRENKTLGRAFGEDMYFVDSQISRTMPLVFPEFINLLKFIPDDFYYLDTSDTSASRIYYNGEFWTYYIKAQTNATRLNMV